MNADTRRADPGFLALKAAWRLAIAALGGGALVHEATRGAISRSLISRYGKNHESCVVPADVALTIDRACMAAGERPMILAAYADALGFEIVPQRKAQAEGLAYDEHVADVTGAVCGLMTAAQEARRDGVVDERDLEAIAPHIDRAQTELAEFDAEISDNVTALRKRA